MGIERFSFAGHGGHELSGRLELPDGDRVGVALFAHCFTCSKDVLASSRISRHLARQGWAVLRFDFTGLGDSGGDFADTHFSSNTEDLVLASEALAEELAAPDLLVGHSLGGAACIAAATRLPEVRAVATIAAPSEPRQLLRHFTDDEQQAIAAQGEAEVSLAGRSFRVKQAFLDDVQDWRLREHVRALGRPLLVLHSPDDRTVSIEQAGRLMAAALQDKGLRRTCYRPPRKRASGARAGGQRTPCQQRTGVITSLADIGKWRWEAAV